MKFSPKVASYFLVMLLLVLPFLAPTSSLAATTFNKTYTSFLTNGLVGHWTFDGKDTNWGTNKTNDLSGKGNTGTMVSMSTTTSPIIGKIGQAMKFNGSTNYVTAGNAASLNMGTGNLSVAFWIKTTDTTGPIYIAKTGFICGSDGGWGVQLNSSGRVTESIGVPNVGCDFTTPNDGAVVNDNKWHHVVVVFNRTTAIATRYVDGVVSGSADTLTVAGNVTTSQPFCMGARCPQGVGSEFLNGNLDDVRIYNRTLSATEVSRLYKLGQATANVSPVLNLTSGLLAYWTFDGKNTSWASNTTSDVSGNGNIGRMTSMSTTTSPIIGKIGQGLYFDGSNDTIDVTNTASLNSANVKTVSLWINRRVLTTNIPRIISQETDASNFWSIAIPQTGNIDENAVSVTVKVAGTETNIKSPNNSINTTNQWYHVVTVWNGASVSAIYINGVSQSLSTAANLLSGGVAKLSIGNRTDGARPVDGRLDDVRIYNRTLSATEVSRLYKLGQATANVSPVLNLTSGLVGYWTFDGKNTNWASNTTSDVSGNGNTGRMTSMSTTTSPIIGKLGQALSFDGVNDYVDSSNFADNLPAFSVSTWFKTSSPSTAYPDMVSKSTAGNSTGVGWMLFSSHTVAGRIFFLVQGPNGSNWIGRYTTTAYNDDKWHHVVAIYSAGTLTLYVDGAVPATATDNGGTLGSFSNSNNVRIGTDYNGQYFNGSLDDVRIYSRALSAAEVSRLYTLGR